MRAAALTPRRATPADVPALAAMLARAFDDDPVARWCCPPDELRPTMLERFYEVWTRQLLREEECWTLADRCGAALWAPPQHWRSTWRDDLELIRAMLHPRLLGRVPLVTRGMTRLQDHHPRTPHWYLAVLATDPALQGHGIGSALLAPVLERCDADGVGAYLESSKERNVDFYARHGFRVTETYEMPRGGPRMWLMWRDPR